MGARDDRHLDYTDKQRLRMLEQDQDKADDERREDRAEIARLKGIALGLLLMVTAGMAGAIASGLIR